MEALNIYEECKGFQSVGYISLGNKPTVNRTKLTASSGNRMRSFAKYPLLVSVGIILPAPMPDFSSLFTSNLYLGRILRSASDAPSYLVKKAIDVITLLKSQI